MKMKWCIACLCALAVSAGVSRAADIAWQSVFNIDMTNGAEDLAPGGPILYALNVGEDPAGSFASVSVTNSRETITFEAFRQDGLGSASGSFYTGDGGASGNADLDQILNSHSWLGGTDVNLPFQLTDLTPGVQYQVQFIAAADRRSCCRTRTQTLDDGNGHATDPLSREGVGSVIGVFTADDVSQLVNLSGATDPGLSAVVVRQVPEPAMGGLFLLATLAMAAKARRR
ncbi:MAG: PEP-CTERM sorting domain-containing protein [Pirellulaceae bacterium]|nr:PEP-CTERM sorting domain-containing protein [Planctomycetales bacterium]